MKLKTLKKLCMFMCAIVFSSALVAEAAPDANQLVTQQSARSRNNKNGNGGRSMWKPYFMKLRDAEPMMTSFYQQNVGIGFLYFSGIKGNLQPTNNNAFLRNNKKLTGHLMYNRTPLMEFVVGTDIFRWWKVGISYQHQGGVVVQTRPEAPLVTAGTTVAPQDLTSHVRLDAIEFKTYFMLPKTLVWFNLYHEPYLGIGVGPGWQSWVDVDVPARFLTRLRPKFSANCVFTIDFGWKFRKAMPNYVMSFTAGCKYNEWGQARSIGKANQQYASSINPTANGNKSALIDPFRIKTVYQFAPYIGVQFNF